LADILHFGLLLFPDVEPLDFVGPAQMVGGVPGASVHLISKSLAPVTTSKGWQVVPTVTYADCPGLDIVCVPGGIGVNALLEDEETIAFLCRQAATARYVTSVCTGSLVLAAAGLLDGYRATCHWMSRDLLGALGAIPTAGRVVKDRNRITGAGVTAGIDFALAILGELYGEETARMVQLSTEYDPQPPYDAGAPDKAGPALVARATEAAKSRQETRTRIIERIVARRTR
jgi:cyclohexyl-isocyanide hydratase